MFKALWTSTSIYYELTHLVLIVHEREISEITVLIGATAFGDTQLGQKFITLGKGLLGENQRGKITELIVATIVRQRIICA